MNKKKLRIIVSAYGCEPEKGSEQGVGWNWTLQLARFAELVVITRSNNHKAIYEALPEVFRDCVRFEYYDLPKFVLRLKRKEKGLYFYYIAWQLGAYIHARRLVQKTSFDYVISLTFGSIWMPTFMHLLPIPFIWGPLGGGEAVPFQLIKTLPFRARLTQYIRYFLMSVVRFNPFVMWPIRRAKAVLVRTKDTARLIPSLYKNKVKIVLETAIPEGLLTRTELTRKQFKKEPLQVIYSGRLIALKNVSAAIRAIAQVLEAGLNVQFVIVGDGPERNSLETLARSLGISKHVYFLGAMTQDEVFTELQKSDIYLFPSLKEGGVWSLMEAMAVGLPVVCLGTSGMSIITDDNSAIRVSPLSQEHIISGFTKALIELAGSPELRLQLGQNARRRIEQYFRWDHKGAFIQKLFEDIEQTSS